MRWFRPDLFERLSGLPSPEFSRQRRSGQQAVDFASLGADAVGIGLDMDRGAELGRDPLDEFADRDVLAPAYVDGRPSAASQPAMATKPETVSLT